MNKYIETQLQKCNFAKLDDFDSTTNTYHIKKYSKPTYQIGKCYLVRLSGDVINNTTSPLAINFNEGRAPRSECYKIYVNQLVGKMVKVDALAFDDISKTDLPDMFSGYLPIDSLEQISIL